MSTGVLTVAATFIDAAIIGVVGALVYWALWGGSASSVAFIGVLGGTLTALFMKVQARPSLGEALVSRLRR